MSDEDSVRELPSSQEMEKLINDESVSKRTLEANEMAVKTYNTFVERINSDYDEINSRKQRLAKMEELIRRKDRSFAAKMLTKWVVVACEDDRAGLRGKMTAGTAVHYLYGCIRLLEQAGIDVRNETKSDNKDVMMLWKSVQRNYKKYLKEPKKADTITVEELNAVLDAPLNRMWISGANAMILSQVFVLVCSFWNAARGHNLTSVTVEQLHEGVDGDGKPYFYWQAPTKTAYSFPFFILSDEAPHRSPYHMAKMVLQLMTEKQRVKGPLFLHPKKDGCGWLGKIGKNHFATVVKTCVERAFEVHDDRTGSKTLRRLWSSRVQLKLTTHSCRRSFATAAYRANVPLQQIMLVTGHKTEKSLLQYVDGNVDTRKAVVGRVKENTDNMAAASSSTSTSSAYCATDARPAKRPRTNKTHPSMFATPPNYSNSITVTNGSVVVIQTPDCSTLRKVLGPIFPPK